MKINGKITAATYKNIEELLTDNGYKIKYVAVECNGNIIPKNMYGKYVPGADDVIEVVTFVGGGWYNYKRRDKKSTWDKAH